MQTRNLVNAFIMALWLFSPAKPAAQQFLDASWMSGTWDANDQAFIASRKKIEAVRGNAAALDRIIASSRRECDSNKATSVDLYVWAYATYLRCMNDFDYWYKVNYLTAEKAPYELFPKLSKPHSYEFTRVRLVFTVTFDFAHRKMIDVGERLVKRDGDDPIAVIALLKLYQPQISEEHRAKGLMLVAKLDQLAPGTLGVEKNTSFFYYLCWQRSKSKADAAEAVRRAQIALKLCKSERQRKLIKQAIEEMQKA
jgi:hypothetical protein